MERDSKNGFKYVELLEMLIINLVSVCLSLNVLQGCQILRIVTFYSTQLPGPNYHCREVINAYTHNNCILPPDAVT